MQTEIEFPEYMKFIKKVEKNLSDHTLRSYRNALGSFINSLGIESIKFIEGLTRDDISDYLDSLREEGLSSSSVNAHLRVIKVFCNWLFEGKYISKDPTTNVKLLKESKKIRAVIADEEFQAMLYACNDIQEKLMISLMRYAGLRREEVTNIKIEDIKDGKILVHGKGDKEREIPLNDYILKVLYQYLETRKDNVEWLFVSQRGTHKITAESVRLRIKTILEDAGIERDRIDQISCHTFRRTTATTLLNEGVDGMVVKNILGHSALSTTQKYIQNCDEAMEKAIANQKVIGD